MSNDRLIVLGPGEARPTRVAMAPDYLVKAGEADTEGRFSLLEVNVRHDIPLHVHERSDECFWLLDGEMEVTFGDQKYHVTPGTFMLLPHGVPHGVRCLSETRPRLMQVSAPGGFEHFAEDLLEAQREGRIPSLTSKEFADLASKHDWTLVLVDDKE